jgi:hypothetical protein
MFLKEYIEQGANDRNFNKQQAEDSGVGDAWTRWSGNNLNPIKPKTNILLINVLKVSFLDNTLMFATLHNQTLLVTM